MTAVHRFADFRLSRPTTDQSEPLRRLLAAAVEWSSWETAARLLRAGFLRFSGTAHL
jgi:hypothetical protein